MSNAPTFRMISTSMGEGDNFQLRVSPQMKNRLSVFTDPSMRDLNEK